MRLDIATKKLTILVLDSHDDCADTLAELLGMYGHTVTSARSVAAAVRAAAADPPDVLVVEPWLRGEDGWAAVGRVRAALPAGAGLLVVAVTVGGMADDYAKSAVAGVDVHLVKPAPPGELRAVLEWHAGRLARFELDGAGRDRQGAGAATTGRLAVGQQSEPRT